MDLHFGNPMRYDPIGPTSLAAGSWKDEEARFAAARPAQPVPQHRRQEYHQAVWGGVPQGFGGGFERIKKPEVLSSRCFHGFYRMHVL